MAVAVYNAIIAGIIQLIANWNDTKPTPVPSVEGMTLLAWVVIGFLLWNAKHAAKEIIRNRRVVREIPAYTAAWFFQNWPQWVKYCAGIGTILATLTATATLGGTIYGWVNEHANAPLIALQHVKEVDQTIVDMKAVDKAHTAELQTTHDDQIKIFERMGGMEKKIDDVKNDTKSQLDRIEAKLDRR